MSIDSKNPNWVAMVVQAIQIKTAEIEQPELKQAAIEATLTLAAHKDDITSLGLYGLSLFIQKLANGDLEEAYISYIETQASFQQLIDGELADAKAIIENKIKRDQMRAKAESIALDLAITGAKILLPLLLTLI